MLLYRFKKNFVTTSTPYYQRWRVFRSDRGTMFIIAQFPFADIRPLLASGFGRLKAPDWASDEPKGFVRGFGKVSPRNSSGLGLVGESCFGDMTNAIKFPDRIEYGEDFWRCSLHVIPWFRRLYFDGQIAGRFEVGFLIPEFFEELAFDGSEKVAIEPPVLAQRVLSTNVQINSIDGSKIQTQFGRCAKALGMAYLAATTSNEALKLYPIDDTIGSRFFVGDPFISVRVASGRPISVGRDRRYLTNHNECDLFITSARGSDRRNNVIVQASENDTRNETVDERVIRVLFAHLNSLIFAYAQVQSINDSIEGQANRDVLRHAVSKMIKRLEQFKPTSTAKDDAAFSAALNTFAKAYAGRIEELTLNLESLSELWNKRTITERFVDYFKGVHDLVIKTGVEKAIEISAKGGM